MVSIARQRYKKKCKRLSSAGKTVEDSEIRIEALSELETTLAQNVEAEMEKNQS